MEYIICFYTKGKKPDVMRFVKSARVNFLGRLKMEVTVDINEAKLFPMEMAERVNKKLKAMYGNDFYIEYITNASLVTNCKKPFYVITVENKRHREYLAGIAKNGVELVNDVRKAYISQSLRDISSVITIARQKNVGKARVVHIYMNVENVLQQEYFVIVVVSRQNGMITYFVDILQDSSVKSCDSLEKAKRFGYDDAVTTFENLSARNTKYFYAVIPVPKGGIAARELPEYIKSHGNNKRIIVSLKLKD